MGSAVPGGVRGMGGASAENVRRIERLDKKGRFLSVLRYLKSDPFHRQERGVTADW